MGVRSSSAVREVIRCGEPRLVIDFRYRDNDGRQQRYRRDATIQLVDAAAAEARRLRVQADGAGRVESKPAAPLFRDFARGAFADRYMARKCRPATRERYEALFRQGVLDAFGSMRLDEIGAPQFHSYEAALARRGIQTRPHLSLVRTVVRVAVQWGELARMPTLPKLSSAPRKRLSAPSTEDINSLLMRATGWLRIAIALAAYAGLSIGEICALQVRDIDLRESCLKICRTLSAAKKMPLPSGEPRIVRLAPELEVAVTHVVEHRAPTSRVIVNAAGRTPRRQHVLAALKRLQAQCGLREQSFRALQIFGGGRSCART